MNTSSKISSDSKSSALFQSLTLPVLHKNQSLEPETDLTSMKKVFSLYTVKSEQTVDTYNEDIFSLRSERESFSEITLENFTLQNDIHGFFKKAEAAETKLCSHFSSMGKCDKYIRLITSTIKIHKAFHPVTKLLQIYKELQAARRVIRFQSQYQNIIELFAGNLSTPNKAFKIMQLIGDYSDCISFFTKFASKKGNSYQNITAKLQKLEANCYFVQCCIYLLTYSFKYFNQTKQTINQTESEKKERKNQLTINLLKTIKYILDTMTSYNNSSFQFKEINPKIAGIFNFLSSIIGIYLIWR